jgi:superfamily I DNA/RNA helicase
MMRTLSGPAFGLSDASVVALCSEPANAQPLLFEELDEKAERRWDRKRDIRLGWNVVRGDNDAALSPAALERLSAFRALRERWNAERTRLEFADFAALVFDEGLARAGAPGSARAANQVRNVARLVERISRYTVRYPDATVGDFLTYADQRMASTLEACEEPQDVRTVRILDITSSLGQEFDHVLVPNVRAGSFPHYYAPDAFLFSPSLGMIAKENVGDATASRTAKFTYYMFRTRTREQYNAEERRAFVYAMRRARKSLFVSASERPTRGRTSPEFLSELQAARIPGSSDVSDHWRPAHITVA